MSNEKTLDGFLGDKLKIFQLKNGYRAGHDAVILASSITAKKGDNCLELGIGSCVVSLRLAYRVKGIKILGFENNTSMLEISNKNIEINNFQEIIFSKPIDKFGYFMGKFSASLLLSTIPLTGVFFAVIIGSKIAPLMGWIEPERYGPLYFQTFVSNYFIFK